MEPLLSERRPSAAAATSAGGSLVARCIDPRHPTLQGRVRVTWSTPEGEERNRWVPALQDLAVRRGDRLLLVRAENRDEPIAVGVVDGFARRPRRERTETAALELQPDECLRIHGKDGTDLVEIHASEGGPVVRLLQEDVDVELPGDLRITAEDIALRARQGRVSVRATDDVVLEGETVRLN